MNATNRSVYCVAAYLSRLSYVYGGSDEDGQRVVQLRVRAMAI